jgi:hypothetical protein
MPDTTASRLGRSDRRRKRSRNKPRSGSVSFGAPASQRQSGDVRSASPGPMGAGAARASGRYGQIRHHRGTCLHGVACRRAIGDAKRSSATADARQHNGIGTSADHRCFLHRGNDGNFLQRRHRPEHRRLWCEERFRIEQRIDQRVEHRPGRRHIVDSAMPCRAAIQRIVQLIENGQTGLECR